MSNRPTLTSHMSDIQFIDYCHERLSAARGTLWLLIRTFGGEVDAEHREESDLVMAIQAVGKFLNECYDIEHYPERFTNAKLPQAPHLFTSICAAVGIVNTLDAMTWSDSMGIVGSDDIMCDLLSAVDICVREALVALHAEPLAVVEPPPIASALTTRRVAQCKEKAVAA